MEVGRWQRQERTGEGVVFTLSPPPLLRTLTFDVLERGCWALGVDADDLLAGTSPDSLPAPEGELLLLFLTVVLENAEAYDLTSMRPPHRLALAGAVAAAFWEEYGRELATYSRYRQRLAERHPLVPKPGDEGGKKVTLRCELTRIDPVQYDAMCHAWPLSRLLIYMEAARFRKFFDDVEEAVKKAAESVRAFA